VGEVAEVQFGTRRNVDRDAAVLVDALEVDEEMQLVMDDRTAEVAAKLGLLGRRLCQVLLNDEEVEPDRRLDEMLDVLTEKNWESIRADYDPTAWEFAETTGEPEPEPPAGDQPAAEQRRPTSDLDATMLNS